MPALAGEPWRAAARVTADNLGSKRNFAVGVGIVNATPSGDQATWEASPGGTLTLTYRTSTSGAAPPGAPNTVTVELRLPGGAQVGAADWVNPVDGATLVMHFDDEPLNAVANAARAGTLEIWLRAQRTDIGTYDIDSRGAGAGAADEWARGYLRARVTVSAHSISDVAIAGAEPTKFYATKPVHTRATLDAVTYRSIAPTLELKRPSDGAVERSGAASSGTAVNRDFSWTGQTGTNRRIGNGMQLAEEAKDLQLLLPAQDFGGDNEYVFAATGHQANWVRDGDLELRYPNRVTVDPRISFDKVLQLNDNVFGSPPLSKDVAAGQRLTADLGFLAARAKDVSGTGLNGLAWTDKAWDNGNLTGSEGAPTISRNTAVSQAQGTQDGWADGFLVWDKGLPSGAWTQKIIITGPADVVGLEVNNTRTLTLLSKDPRVRLVVDGGDLSRPGTHWSPGQPLNVGVSLVKAKRRIAFDAGTAAVALLRPAVDGSGQVYAEFFDSDKVWKTADGDFYFWPCTASPADSKIATVSFTAVDTANFNTNNLTLLGYAEVGGVPEIGVMKEEAVSSISNPHDRWHAVREAIG